MDTWSFIEPHVRNQAFRKLCLSSSTFTDWCRLSNPLPSKTTNENTDSVSTSVPASVMDNHTNQSHPSRTQLFAKLNLTVNSIMAISLLFDECNWLLCRISTCHVSDVPIVHWFWPDHFCLDTLTIQRVQIVGRFPQTKNIEIAGVHTIYRRHFIHSMSRVTDHVTLDCPLFYKLQRYPNAIRAYSLCCRDDRQYFRSNTFFVTYKSCPNLTHLTVDLPNQRCLLFNTQWMSQLQELRLATLNACIAGHIFELPHLQRVRITSQVFIDLQDFQYCHQASEIVFEDCRFHNPVNLAGFREDAHFHFIRCKNDTLYFVNRAEQGLSFVDCPTRTFAHL